MPELPDVELYVAALRERIVGQPLERVRLVSPFLLRSFEPPIEAAHGRAVDAVRRMGKRIVFELEAELFLVLHLMIAGRLHWKTAGVKLRGKTQLAAFDFASGTLLLTEASPKKRASLHLVRGKGELAALDPGGMEVLETGLEEFTAVLTRVNRTLKRALTDPRSFSGIGNAYSDEILHRAGLSPLAQTQKLMPEQVVTLYQSIRSVLEEWIERFRRELKGGFPEKVTAFRPEMAAHGRFGLPCPVCGIMIERIVYAENECNYCPRCQTGGRRLADRSLSRLLKEDYPRDIEE